MQHLGFDVQLVVRVRNGDEAALDEIFRNYAPALAAFVDGYVKSTAIAEEIVQDVFLWIVRNRERWTVKESIRSYLYGAARNRALDYLKHSVVEQRWAVRSQVSNAGWEPMGEIPIDTQLVIAEQISALRRAIAKLPESRRTTLTLRWNHGLSYAEIAAIIGSSPKAVENQLNRTLNSLRKMLQESF